MQNSLFRLQMRENSLRSLGVIQTFLSRLCQYLATQAMVNRTPSITHSLEARKSSQHRQNRHRAQWGYGRPLTPSEMPSSWTAKVSLVCRPIKTSEHDCCWRFWLYLTSWFIAAMQTDFTMTCFSFLVMHLQRTRSISHLSWRLQFGGATWIWGHLTSVQLWSSFTRHDTWIFSERVSYIF